MPKFRVSIREVHISIREVEASTEEEAKILAAEDLDTEVAVEYDYSLDDNTWNVEKI